MLWKMIIANAILIALIYFTPEVNLEEETPVISEPISSRGNNKTREEEIQKNLKLDITSDLTVISNLSAEDFDKMLANTKLNGLGKALVQAEKEHSVNGLYLMGLACLESGYGKSKYAVERNNLVGWNATDKKPNGASYFTSKDECILYVAHKLKTNYLTEGGCYFNGYTARDIDKKYCTDKKHADKIINIINKLKGEL